MISFILRGILIGLLFGIPAGAVGAMTVQRTLTYGMKAGLLTGLGSSAADCFYACVGAFGLTLISDFMLRYQKIIYLAGGCLIISMGMHLLLKKKQEVRRSADPTGSVRMFLSSFAVGIMNPAAIFTFLFAFAWFGIPGQTGVLQGTGLVFGVFIGTYIWWGTLSSVAAFWKKQVKHSYLRKINSVFGIILILFGAVVLTSACGSQKNHEAETIQKEAPDRTGSEQMREMIIETGGQSFQVELYQNDTSKALADRLPMTLRMEEINGNEKFYYMEKELPASPDEVKHIQSGDIMLYGSDCLVLFFENFDTSYKYTRIGHVKDAKEFEEALSDGIVDVSFSTRE